MQKKVPGWLIDLIQSIYINYSDNARARAGHLGLSKNMYAGIIFLLS